MLSPKSSKRRDFLKGVVSGIITGTVLFASLVYGFPRTLKVPGPTTTKTLTKTEFATVTDFKTETYVRTVTKTETKTVTASITLTTEATISAYTTLSGASIPEEFIEIAKKIPGVAQFNPVIDGDKIIYYEVYDSRNILIGYAFRVRVVTCPDILMVTGVIDLNYNVIAVDVEPSKDLPWVYPAWWTKAVNSPDFEEQFSGLSVQELYLDSDGGKIHAISGATLSSRAITEALRKKIETIISGRDHFDTYKPPQPCPAPMG